MTRLQTVGLEVNPAEESIVVGPLDIRFLLTGENSSGSIATFEMTVPPSEGLPAPPHSHDGYEETAYGLSGVLTVTVEGKTFEISPGQAACVPRGAVHSFRNSTREDAKVLCVITPAAIGPEYFREVGAVLKAAAGGPPDRAKLVEIMHRNGLKPAMPPA
jgi:quercetin dioxygenase-like cupin family protein